MTPGDRNPNRYRGKTALTAAMLALVAAGATAPDLYSQYIDEREGSRLKAYLDGGSTSTRRIWTICRGLTMVNGKPVYEGQRLSRGECDQLDREEQARGLAGMKQALGSGLWDPLSNPAKAGIASFCWHNLGWPKCSGSTFIAHLRAGRRNEACAEITKWIRDGGKDCRIRSNGCIGQVERRQQEDELCLITAGEP